VVVTDLTVLFVRPRGFPVAVPLVAWVTAFSPLVMGRLPATADGYGAVGSLVLRVDGSDGTAGSAAVQQVGIFRHHRAVLEIFGDQWSLISEGRRRRNMAMKTVQGLESVGSRAFICRIRSVDFMCPISGNFNNSNALVQWALVYLDTSRALSCS
jgi:hypothetical protein